MFINAYFTEGVNRLFIEELLINSELIIKQLVIKGFMRELVEFNLYDKPVKSLINKQGFLRTNSYALMSYLFKTNSIFFSDKPFKSSGYLMFTKGRSSFISLYNKSNNELFNKLVSSNNKFAVSNVIELISDLTINDYSLIIAHEVSHLQGLNDCCNPFMSIKLSYCLSCKQKPYELISELLG